MRKLGRRELKSGGGLTLLKVAETGERRGKSCRNLMDPEMTENWMNEGVGRRWTISQGRCSLYQI